jgi:holo-[acyl-carrier protein] synthase
VDADGVIAEAFVVLDIAEVEALLRTGDGPFTSGELAYARSKSDPERRLAARLAAKRAAVEALGGDVPPSDVEVVRGLGGPPGLRLTGAAARRLAERGGRRAVVSLTHGRAHAAAAVLLLER